MSLLTVTKKMEGAIVEIAMGKAPANIISSKLIGELKTLIQDIENNKDCKMIILTGEGDHFSYGASVEEHSRGQVNGMLPQFHLLVDKILDCKVPVLARVRGNCLGGGFEVALACHFIFSEKQASFAVPEVKLGVFPPPACALLNSKVSENIANEMIITGANKTGAELCEMGLVNEVADNASDLDEKIKLFIEKKIIKTSASSIRFATMASRQIVVKRYRSNIAELELMYLDQLMRTHDANEGIQSFIEKRRPVWTNM